MKILFSCYCFKCTVTGFNIQLNVQYPNMHALVCVCVCVLFLCVYVRACMRTNIVMSSDDPHYTVHTF